jgi:hypothetical protein
MATEKEDKKYVKLTNVRLAFPQLFEAKSFQGEGAEMYSASFLIDPSTKEGKAQVEEIEKELLRVAKNKWGAKADAILKSMKSADKTCLHDGDLKSEYDGFEGMVYVSCRSKTRPLVVDRDRSVLTEKDGRPYGGCVVNTSIELWPMDNNFGKRINASLRGVQFVKDGEAFAGGAPASEDEFDSIEDGEDLA